MLRTRSSIILFYSLASPHSFFSYVNLLIYYQPLNDLLFSSIDNIINMYPLEKRKRSPTPPGGLPT